METSKTLENVGASALPAPQKEGAKPRQYPEEMRQAARSLYLRRYTVQEIAECLNVPKRTVYHWAATEEWDALLTHESPEQAVARRLTLLVERDNKTPAEMKEVDQLLGSLERLQALRLRAAQQSVQQGGQQAGGQDEGARGGVWEGNGQGQGNGQGEKPRPKRGPKIKNDVSHLTPALFQEKFHQRYFEYQRQFQAAMQYRNRMFLKARQIGATWYFAQEAFENACLTGDNQIFLSATKAQAQIFRQYIIQLAGEAFDITLSGNPMVLHTGKGATGKAELHFLSTSSRSAQGYHGHVYIDEFFWIPKFKALYDVASAMSAHKKWRRTLFSTPSCITHQAYPKWSGEEWQKRFAKQKNWPTIAAMRGGLLCPDRVFRQIVTLDDAVRGGCDLFDLEELKIEYTKQQYAQLFDCEFLDDTQAVFALQLLENCMGDKADWEGINLAAPRPVGNRGVWAGYDPSRTRDDASFVIILPPLGNEKMRVIERHKWVDKSYIWQAEQIKNIAQKYQFDHCEIDTTGPGIGVYEHVKTFLPIATPVHYSVQNKARLVLKAKEVMEQNRLEWDAAETDIAHAFMTIRQVALDNGGMTYAAGRTADTGHADAAWSIMHALAYEPLGREFSGNQSCVAFG
ncbi:terminase large subunit domain-containing protein [Desulfovibrio cuneatus]|uniref:terminase large subunit domain-containing protein n=1 Tax=Desulfovibrio cuneatus TaxID=159728 RepID=UPI000422E057|nr:terminase family protein [Desulfovibrio cuneatus]